jgi:hypothetical protein
MSMGPFVSTHFLRCYEGAHTHTDGVICLRVPRTLPVSNVGRKRLVRFAVFLPALQRHRCGLLSSNPSYLPHCGILRLRNCSRRRAGVRRIESVAPRNLVVGPGCLVFSLARAGKNLAPPCGVVLFFSIPLQRLSWDECKSPRYLSKVFVQKENL